VQSNFMNASHRSWSFSERKKRVAFGFLVLALCFAPGGRTQQQPGTRETSGVSELALQNLSRVAASAQEIKTILVNNAGLMVELKRWVAKDASDHGQILNDADLSSDTIFDRLENDVKFRFVSTALLQRYGYLLAKINPDSDAAKQHALVMQERAKWLANKDQGTELTQASLRMAQTWENTVSCDSQFESDCMAPQIRPYPSVGPGQTPQLEAPPSGTFPSRKNPANAQGGNSIMRAQMNQTEEDSSSASQLLPLTGSYSSAPAYATLNANISETVGPRSTGAEADRFLNSPSAGGIFPFARGSDGLLATNGGEANSGSPSGASSAVPQQTSIRQTERTEFPRQRETNRKQSPYEDIPSLYDMYLQAVARPATPARFGAEVFNNGTRDSQLIPMDLPVGPDYIVGPGDGLSINLWGGVSQRLNVTVDREGRVNLPEVGPLLVSGKSLAVLQQNLQESLRTQFRNVSADVSLSRLRTIRVYEVGDVAVPGAYDISSLSTPLNALFVAGGPTSRGSLRTLKHYRGTQLIQTLDMYDLLLHGVKTDLQRLENGDSVQVPSIGPQVTVEGMVRRPAIYEMRDEKNLADVLELAGGLLPAAALRHIEVQRLVAHDKQTMLSLEIPDMADTSEITRKLESFEIHDGDRIRIYPIVPYSQDAIYLDGHVARPGRYSYRADMRVTDVISSYQELLPEPATQYAEIIRLNAPDFHPSIEAFDLAKAFANPAQSPVLHPMDTVRIFSRFDFENPPMVSVGGEVRRPGAYQTSGQVHLSDAIHLAGGLAPDAETEDVQVFRNTPDGKLRIFSANLSRALAGDPSDNILLQPRDHLLIHRNASQVQPATVYIEGEVARPGRYALSTDMHLADLIRIGGGLILGADTQSADLTKYQWKKQTELTGQHETIALSAAISGDATANVSLHNGDVLTIRQLPGWNDLGASIRVNGEVKHPGTYGIRPGERLSSVLERVGGFLPAAYPKGIVFQREEVRQLEKKSRDDLIQHIRLEPTAIKPSLQESGQDQAALAAAALAQRDSAIAALQQAPIAGRLVVRLPNDIARFRGSPDDIEVRRGDTVFIPKMPQFVVVTGQIYSSNAITYRQGRNAAWYLQQAGGPTEQANQKATFIIRANGSIVSNQGSGLWNGGALSTNVEPGDTIVVPEKAIGGSSAAWKNLIAISQLASAAATTAFIATR
jgi:polysaccharide export outer membrane protein